MPTRSPLAPLAFLALRALVVIAVTGGSPARAAADGFALVANARAGTASLSKSDVRALYTGKAKTLGGNAVVVVVRGEDDAPFGQFVDQVFGIPARALLAKIKQEVFKGEMQKPVKAASDDEVVQAVERLARRDRRGERPGRRPPAQHRHRDRDRRMTCRPLGTFAAS